MQLIRYLLWNFYLNMFRASLGPSSGEQDRVLPHMVFCTGCAGCGCVELRRKLCALCESYCSSRTVTHTVIHGLVLLMMGIMMPETCWDRSLIINIWLVVSCWFFSLHPTQSFILIKWACWDSNFPGKKTLLSTHTELFNLPWHTIRYSHHISKG